MRRRTQLVAACGLLSVVCGSVLCWWASKNVISVSNFDRIKIGMTSSEVENTLGPPRWEVATQDPKWFLHECGSHFDLIDEWWGKEGVVQVWYGDGRVIKKAFTDHRCEVRPLSLAEKYDKWCRERQRRKNKDDAAR